MINLYYNQSIINYAGNHCYSTFYFREIPYRDSDSYFTVTVEYMDRLDLVAYDFYSNVDLWYVIAIASDITNPLDVPVGTVLRIPSLVSLYSTTGIGIQR